LHIMQNTFSIEEITMIDYDEITKRGLYLNRENDSTYSQIGSCGKYTIAFRNTSYGKDIAYIDSESPAIKRICNNKTIFCYQVTLRIEYKEFYSGVEMKNIDLTNMKPMKDMYNQNK
jgi:hypothetical protein